MKVAKALLHDSELTLTEAAKRLGVAPSTLYKHPVYDVAPSAGIKRGE